MVCGFDCLWFVCRFELGLCCNLGFVYLCDSAVGFGYVNDLRVLRDCGVCICFDFVGLIVVIDVLISFGFTLVWVYG